MNKEPLKFELKKDMDYDIAFSYASPFAFLLFFFVLTFLFRLQYNSILNFKSCSVILDLSHCQIWTRFVLIGYF